MRPEAEIWSFIYLYFSLASFSINIIYLDFDILHQLINTHENTRNALRKCTESANFLSALSSDQMVKTSTISLFSECN